MVKVSVCDMDAVERKRLSGGLAQEKTANFASWHEHCSDPVASRRLRL